MAGGDQEMSLPGDKPDGFFQSLLERVSDSILVLGPDGRIRYANPAVCTLIGQPASALLGASLFDHIHPDDIALVSQGLDGPLTHADGEWFGDFQLAVGSVEKRVRARAVNQLEDPAVAGIVLTMQDITDLRALEDELRNSRELYRRLFNEVPVMFLLARPVDGVPTVHDCNARFLARLGYRLEEVVGRPLADLYTPESADDMLRLSAAGAYDHYTVGKTLVTERGLLTSTGEVVPTLAEAMTEFDSAGKLAGVRVAYLEITERKQLEERLIWQAFHDPLTGLPNRALFLNRLQRALVADHRRPDRLAILYMDLDRFKPVNDRYGHSAGDQVLNLLSRRLEACVRESDTVARLAGDEFAILLERIDIADRAPVIAERVLASLRDPFHLPTGMVTVSASIGIAYSRTGRESPDELLRAADTALYRAKNAGKSRYTIYSPEMDSLPPAAK